ncbi:MAG: ATP-binding protein [Myxococcaceae bacterium]
MGFVGVLGLAVAGVLAVVLLRERRAASRLELKVAQARENEAMLRLALDAASEFLWDGDLVTGEVVGSAQAAAWLGYPLSEWPPKPWNLIVHEDDRAAVDAAIRAAVRGESRTYRIRHRLRRKDGEVLHAVSTGVVIREPGGKPVRFVGFVRDITREVQEESHRLQAQKLESLGLMAGGIAHDFNNLLTVVGSSLELVRRSPLPSDAADLLDTAQTAAQRATALSRQLLAYSGRTPVTQGAVALNELVRSIAGLLSVSVSKKITLEQKLGPDTLAVQGDPNQLQQVLLNLVTNAAEAIGERAGKIIVSTESPEPGKVRLSVSDNGSGIAPEVQARMFDPFFSTKGSGRGLGLAVIHGIVKTHQGTLTVETKAGEGTRFVLDLPQVAPPAVTAPAPAKPAIARYDLKVLVVDDESIVRKATRRVLERFGCRVDEVDSGQEAIDKVRATPAGWDFVLMDVTMPHLSGTEAAERIRVDAPTLPIVLSSGYSASPPVSGDHLYFVPKPFTIEQIEKLLAKLSGGPARPG